MDTAKAVKVLGIKKGDNFRDVKKKYKKLVLKYHPDGYQGEIAKKRAEKCLKDINEAYHYLLENRAKCFVPKTSQQQTESSLDFDVDFYRREDEIYKILYEFEEMQKNRQNQTYDNVCEEKYSFDKKYDKYTVNYDDCYDTLDGYQDDYDNDADYDYDDYEDYYDDEMPQAIYEENIIRKSKTERFLEILGTIIIGIFYLFLRAINNELDKE